MKVFSVIGIDVYVDYSWFFIFALILGSFAFVAFPQQYPQLGPAVHFTAALACTLLLFGSVLFHELSHSIVAIAHGIKVDRITLFIFGGVSHMTKESDTPGAEIRIAAAGPLASFVLGGGFLLVSWLRPPASGNIWAGMSSYLGAANIGLGVFNLLPGFPLDGGRVLRAWAWSRSGNRARATSLAAAWGRRVGWGMIGFGALIAMWSDLMSGLWMALIGMFLRGAAETERRQSLAMEMLAGVKVGQVMTRDPVAISWRAAVTEAIDEYFLKHSFGGYPVVRDDLVVGVLSMGDLIRCPVDERNQVPVSRVMTQLAPDQMASPAEEVGSALAKMSAVSVTRLPVIDEGHLVGLLTLHAVNRQLRIREIASRGAA